MKKLSALVLVLVLLLSLAACGGPDKQPAIDAFNKTATAFDEVVNAINADPESFDQELIDVMNDMSGLLLEYKAVLEGDQALTEEDLTAIIDWLGTVDGWIVEVKDAYGLN